MGSFCYYESPVGLLKITEGEKGITGIEFSDAHVCVEPYKGKYLDKAVTQLDEYFRGVRKSFDVPLEVCGTAFQEKVWKALGEIPCGETRSYKDIAKAIGNERACRAVGMANNRNPIVIMIPCHRVIGTNHKLVGYAGGLGRKEYLLKLEENR